MKEEMALWQEIWEAVLRAMMGSRTWAVAGCGGSELRGWTASRLWLAD
jgi:hypothetical protein